MNFAAKRNILDIPNERSSHTIPTPRGGGIAIVISWYFGISLLYFTGQLELNLYLALISGIILAGISLFDDIIDIKPSIRIIAQTITVILAFCFLKGIQPISLFYNDSIPAAFLYPITIIGMVWFINLYNFLDGIDGYASVEAICVAVAFFLLNGEGINLVLIASVLGFLIWNWPKAKIFMGDVGSTQLGFILVVLGIYNHNEQTLSFMWWIILTSPFWFDATLTLFRRWRNKERLSQAHRKHVYQRLVQSGYSHLKVDGLLALLNTLLVAQVFLFSDYNWMQIPLLIITLGLLYLITVFTDKRKPFLPD
jgi:Fuc2NAc and GlcNAc transferase